MKYKVGDKFVDPRDGIVGEIVSVSTVYPNDYCIKCDNNNRLWYSESEIEQRFIKIWPPEQYCCDNFEWMVKEGLFRVSRILPDNPKYFTQVGSGGSAKYISLYYCPFCGSETHPENAQPEPTDELEVERRR